MKAGSFAIAALCALGIALLGSAPAQAQEPPVQVLVFHGPSDARTTAGVTAIEELGAAHDFGVEATDEATAFTPDNLDDYRAVIFLNTVGDVLNTAQENALQGYIEDGGGFFGIGEVAEAEEGNSFFTGLLGARPNPNSSTAPSTQTLAVGDRVHPSTRELPLELDREDIWYRWATRPTGQVHTVARYHATNAPAGDGTNVGGTDHPISWCRDYEGGRSFYTGMGRTAASYAEADFRDHLLGAIQWTAGLLRGNCKATINSNYDVQRLTSAGPEGTGLATGGENHGLVVAPNGWVIYIGRADCRTDAERGNVFGSPPIARELNYASPNAGMGCGSVHVWDPEQHEEGNVNSGVTRAGVLAVHGDMGQGGERTNEPNHKIETGLLGIALSPDFMQTGHVYLQYFPSYNPNSTPPGLPIERRISKMSQGRISRFTMNLQTKQLDLSSEVRIFQYDSQVFSCCHRGGGMGFDSQGNLYVTTGDSNSSQGTGGYSGNNQLPTCPTGPVDEASSNHCGDAAYSYQDARRTAGSTNDYNGKMLRLRPIPNVPKGTPVGEGSTYTIPGETAPNGPNLFDGSEGGGGKTKREIYAMGLRNPSRLSIDPETDVPYSAWVGPDAGAPSGTLGPSTYESAAQIDRAGNYGWPYCMGNKQAYRDRTDVLDPNDPDDREPTGEPRTVNGPGYVNGGPAGQPIPGWYDCDNIVNDSKNNTGLSGLLPHETGTGMDAGTMRPSNVWYSRGNPGGNGCPDFPRENGAGNAPNYAAQNTQLCPYATANGATIMNGPVYRYREAGDNSRRWPEYWDGRWFLFDQGNTSIKHGLLLDPATDQDGGQPIYADSLRNMETWQGAYMDSKFGPDGALYVANYQGFFRAPPGMGIFRMDYTGGPSTPFASPTGVAIGDNRVRYSSAGSGGVEYLWEFDDGTTSTQANPVHQYATPGEHTATLTVTYADGETSRRTVTVDVLEEEDTAAPSTSASLRPASPGPGGTYHVPVTTTLTATDTGGTGVAETHYTINGGPELEYSEPFTVSEPDDYVIEFWSEDNAGNVESPHKQVTFRIELVNTCPTDLSDEFTAGPLSDEWEVLRRDDTAISFAGGRLGLQIRSGDMLGGTATAKNVLLKELPEEGNWTATTKFDASELDAEGQQAGLIVWESENPNQFAKVVFIDKGTFEQFEYYTTVNNSPGVLQTQPVTNPPGDVYLRARSNGEGTIFAEWSYDGNEWNQLGAPIRDLGTDLKVGLKVSDNADSTATARFDYFRVDCTDQIAPVTTATVDPERPDGELGWYRTEPTVTLEATDGEAGDGVDRIEYAVDGGEFQEYGGPFTVTGPGEHMVEYRAIDRSPYANQEPTKTLNLWVDPQPASTTASVTGAGNERQVSLEAGDGSGSGVERIEYRVDGGEWQTYDGPAPEEAIMDGTQASLDRWKMAGPGGFDLQPDGSIQGRGGLGMLWYPVEALGDFSLKLQFRDARTDVGHSNSGVFVRFPNPDEVLAPGADRPSCISAEESRPEWVAIFCGQEIQIYDGPTGEPQKTGSVYNFDPLNLEQANPLAKGEWNDYEIRIVGQDYLMIRNGVVINRFDNAIPRDSSRGGDPPTQERQFDRGYIGFQNHGDVDKIQIRNVRVQDLAERSGTGPFRVSGAGNHTVEYRTLDVAGNIEQTKSVSFRIGTPPQPSPPGGGTPPGTTPPDAEPPAQPGLARFSLLGPRRSITTRRLTRRGLTMRIDCTDRMQGVARLRVSRAWARRLDLGRRRTLASKRVRCAASGLTRVTLKPSRGVARKLRRYDRTHRRAVRAVLEVRLKAPFERTRKVTRRVTIR